MAACHYHPNVDKGKVPNDRLENGNYRAHTQERKQIAVQQLQRYKPAQHTLQGLYKNTGCESEKENRE